MWEESWLGIWRRKKEKFVPDETFDSRVEWDSPHCFHRKAAFSTKTLNGP